MTEATELPDANPGNEAKHATQLGILQQAAVILIDEQNRITERLDAKSRNQLTIATTFFAGVQAAVISLVSGPLRPAESGTGSPYVPYLLAAAIVAVAALVTAVLTSSRVWKLRSARALDAQTIRDYIPFAAQGRAGVGSNVVWAYTQIAEARQEQNEHRVQALKPANRACLVTILVASVELVLGFVAVIAA